jgi:hypothetical protein
MFQYDDKNQPQGLADFWSDDLASTDTSLQYINLKAKEETK